MVNWLRYKPATPSKPLEPTPGPPPGYPSFTTSGYMAGAMDPLRQKVSTPYSPPKINWEEVQKQMEHNKVFMDALAAYDAEKRRRAEDLMADSLSSPFSPGWLKETYFAPENPPWDKATPPEPTGPTLTEQLEAALLAEANEGE